MRGVRMSKKQEIYLLSVPKRKISKRLDSKPSVSIARVCVCVCVCLCAMDAKLKCHQCAVRPVQKANDVLRGWTTRLWKAFGNLSLSWPQPSPPADSHLVASSRTIISPLVFISLFTASSRSVQSARAPHFFSTLDLSAESTDLAALQARYFPVRLKTHTEGKTDKESRSI